jgi:AraC-like DNA-binding protein
MTSGRTDDSLPYAAMAVGADYADPFAAHRELVSTIFDLETRSPDPSPGYVAEFAICDYGPIKLSVSAGTTPPLIMARGPEAIARTGVDQFHVQFYRAGGFALIVDGAERWVEAGDICMLDFTRPATLHMTGFDNLSAIVARDLLASLLADVGDVHGLVLRCDSEAAVAVREHMEEMWRRRAELTVAEGLDWSRATAALLAGLIRANSQSRAATRAELRRSQFRAISRRIDREIADPGLGPSTLTRDFHVTRPTLYRMFEPHGGIGKYILGRRLAGAFRDLSDPTLIGRAISEILRTWGFTNHTAAGRAFRTAYGLTPSACRVRARDLHRAGAIAGRKVFDLPSATPAKIEASQRRASRL